MFLKKCLQFIFFIGHLLCVTSIASDTMSFTYQAGEFAVKISPNSEINFGVINGSKIKQKTIVIRNSSKYPIVFEEWYSPSSNLQFVKTIKRLDPREKKEIILSLNPDGNEGKFTKYLQFSFRKDVEQNSETIDYSFAVKYFIITNISDGNILEPPVLPICYSDVKVNKITYLNYDVNHGADITSTKELIKPDEAVWIFAAKDCPSCNYLKKVILPDLFKKNQLPLPWQIISVNLTRSKNLLFYIDLEDKLKAKGDKSPIVYWRGKLFYGSTNIKTLVKEWQASNSTHSEVLNKLLASKTPRTDNVLKKKAEALTVGTIIIAGLIDGINPCVFTTLIFLISMLSISGIKGKKILLSGLIYCFASFITYLSIGLGLLEIIELISRNIYIRQILNILILIGLIVLALLSFKDAFKYYFSNKPSSISLKLPPKLIDAVHSIIRKSLKYKYLLPAIFLIGIVVTIIESVCTGQVYLPILSYMVMQTANSEKWFAMLVLYNIMFIIPLMGIFIAMYIGKDISALRKFAMSNTVAVKIIMGLFFLSLAVIIYSVGVRM